MRIPLSVSTVTLTTHEFAVADWVWSSYFTDCGGKISRLTHSGRKCKQKNTSPLIQACKLVVYINARTYAHINIHTSARRYASNRTQTQNTHTQFTHTHPTNTYHTQAQIYTQINTLTKIIYNSTTLKTEKHTQAQPHSLITHPSTRGQALKPLPPKTWTREQTSTSSDPRGPSPPPQDAERAVRASYTRGRIVTSRRPPPHLLAAGKMHFLIHLFA